MYDGKFPHKIKSFNSLKRLLKQPKTFTMLQTPRDFFVISKLHFMYSQPF